MEEIDRVGSIIGNLGIVEECFDFEEDDQFGGDGQLGGSSGENGGSEDVDFGSKQ